MEGVKLGLHGRLVAWITAACLAGCGAHGDVGLLSVKAGGKRVTMDATIVTPACQFAGSSTVTVSCSFTSAGSGIGQNATITMSGLAASDGMSGPPVMIVQVPADASAIGGTYNNNHGTAGALVVSAGFAELPMDATTNLIAEAGMQLAVVSLPDSAPADTYFLVFSYRSASSTQFKALAAAKVIAGGRAYWSSLAPCTGRFADLPNVPIPQTPVETAIDVNSIAPAYVPCSGKAYGYATTAATPVTVVEYYNASLDHYFITWVPGEIAILDAGVTIRGWTRTGASFQTYSTMQPGTSDICRFYIPPGKGDSHFFGRGTTECEATGVAHPDFVNEEPRFMHMFLPVAGVCASGTVPVYRVFSNRADANHRYMVDRALRDQMVTRGWLAEGDGADMVVMCAPA
jgi:hypothetical protein